jgi:hypothetical protein
MQERRNPADHFKTDETREHEHLQTGEQIQFHDLFPSEAAASGAARGGKE